MHKNTIHVAHLYGEILNSYSDNGNLLVLNHYAKKKGWQLETERISLGDTFDENRYDFVFLGGGQEFETQVVAKDILNKKKNLKNYIEADGVCLAIDSGLQLLGDSFESPQGEKIAGLSLLPHATKRLKDKRLIGEIQLKSSLVREKIAGFENHPGETFLAKDSTPFGQVLTGFGNSEKQNDEGHLYKNTWATYLHGPLLARNPALTETLFDLILTNKKARKD